jgi:hypothetical protein
VLRENWRDAKDTSCNQGKKRPKSHGRGYCPNARLKTTASKKGKGPGQLA